MGLVDHLHRGADLGQGLIRLLVGPLVAGVQDAQQVVLVGDQLGAARPQGREHLVERTRSRAPSGRPRPRRRCAPRSTSGASPVASEASISRFETSGLPLRIEGDAALRVRLRLLQDLRGSRRRSCAARSCYRATSTSSVRPCPAATGLRTGGPRGGGTRDARGSRRP